MTFARKFRNHAATAAVLAVAACSGDDVPYTPPTGTMMPPPPPPPDLTAPSLVSRSPEPDESNVWAGAPIRLVFSEPLAKASVENTSVTVATASGPVPAQVTLSADGKEVRVVVESPHFAPARVTVTAGNTIKDLAGNAFAGASWSFAVPLWQTPGGAPAASGVGTLGPALALDGSDYPIVAWQDAAVAIRVARLSAGKWEPVGDRLQVAADAMASSPHIAVTAAGAPVVVWQESAKETHVYARQLRDGRWEPLGNGPLDAGISKEGALPTVVLGTDDQPVVAWIADNTRIEVRRWNGTAWAPAGAAWDAGARIVDLALALQGTSPVVAAAVSRAGANPGLSSSDVRVVRWADGAGASEIGTMLDRDADHAATHPSIAVSRAGEIGVAWQENDGFSDNVYAARYDEPAQKFVLWGSALDVDFDARAASPSIGFAPDGTPSVAWNELHPEGARTYVARFVGQSWEVPGAGLNRDGTPSSSSAVMALDRAGNPVVAWEEPAESEGGAAAQIQMRRYNGGADLRHADLGRHAAPCSFPLDSAAGFPRTLTDTHCFTDVPRRIPAKGLIPYDVNSPLWSDGALKRRFIILPEGSHIGYSDSFAWQLPIGTILVKEFLLEREPGNVASIYPMETRFLVKRCEPGLCVAAWEGYSYQWNDSGTEATLLENPTLTVFKEWPSGRASHRHGYPGRTECRQCHVNAAGFALGLQTNQMNRSFDYGDAVDNQIRAFLSAGLFRSNDDGGADGGPSFEAGTEGGAPSDGATTDGGAPNDGAIADTGPSSDGHVTDAPADGGASGGSALAPFDKLPRLPVPSDSAHSNNDRVRSYFHSNCSHCHRPDGRWPVIDFLYDSPLVGADEPNTNICNELIPGDAANSRLYIKDSVREGNLPPDFFGLPMPPLATWLVDERQVPVLRNWINEMKSCP